YCVKHMPPGQWPRLNGSKQLSDGTTWWDFNPLHIFSNREGKVWVAGGTERERAPQETARPETADGPAAFDEHGPPRDYAVKDAAIARDASRRLATTATETDLLAAPGGRVIRRLSAGIGLIVLGDAEDGFVPVDVLTRAGEQGYVAESAIADGPAMQERMQERQRDGGARGRERDGDRDRDKRRKASGRGAEPGGTKSKTRPRKSNGRDEPDGSRGSGGQVTTGGGSTSTSTGDRGDRIAAEALRHVGRPYVWATHGPDTFDCSGLVHWVVLQATGQNVSPDSHAQFNLGSAVEWDLLQPGDVVFYDTMDGSEMREGNRASHVGIMIGGGRMVNALNEQAGVREDDPFSDYFKPKYLGARRMA
ncbi:MAG: C40 family peptidase, partial [Thermomicrobiales bacterium]